MLNMEWPEWTMEIYGAMMISIVVAIAYAVVLFILKKDRRIIKKISNVVLSFSAWIFILIERIEHTMDILNNPVSSRLFAFIMCAATITCVNVWTTEIEDSDLSKEA